MTIALDPVRMVRDIDLVSSWLDPFAGLRRDYGVIYADPPWSFATYSAKGRDRCPDAVGSDGGPRHYDLMTIDELKDLPVASLAGPNCKLVLWTTAEIMPRAVEVGEAWGFQYASFAFIWAKLLPPLKPGQKRSPTRQNPDLVFSKGYGTRANGELSLLFRRPGGKMNRLNGSQEQFIIRPEDELIYAPVRKHSQKPDEAAERIERMFEGPYLELFARRRRPGWDVWGDEVPPERANAAA